MKLIDIIEDFLFPPACYFCNKSLPFLTRPLVCDSCFKKHYAFSGKCSRCGNKFSETNGHFSCSTCISAHHSFNGVLSAFYYDEGVSDAIIKHKFNFLNNSAPFLAATISDIINEVFAKRKPDYIVYVPSDKKRLYERGYDAVGEIAEIVSKNVGIPLLKNELLKIKNVPQQSTLTLSERLRNVRGCFKVKNKEKFKGKSFILFDDVYTTGVTTAECAKVMKRAGAEYIMIASVAISKRFKR